MPTQSNASPRAQLAITSLNADSAWILEVDGARLLLDPWLGGAAVVLVPPIHRLYLSTPVVAPSDLPAVDAIVISHPFPDHCHPATLRSFPRDVPVYAPAAVRPWVWRLRHFEKVHVIGNRTRGAAATTAGNVDLSWCRARGALDTVHNGLVFRGRSSGTSILYAPHAMLLDGPTIGATDAAIGDRLDVLLCSFNLVDLPGYVGGVANLGPEAAFGLVRRYKPRYVSRTHDSTKKDSGLLARVTRIEPPPDFDGSLAALGVPTEAFALGTGQTWQPS
ncbi:MAG: MBL fold metallo-hydrolase [Acidobacteriota bacterium]